MEGCFGCPIRCKKMVKMEKPWKIDPVYGGPEYETIGAFGSNCDVDDIAAVMKANELCNRTGWIRYLRGWPCPLPWSVSKTAF